MGTCASNNKFTKPRAIFVEGFEDAEFLRALCENEGLEFDIRANKDLGGTSGITGFKDAIIASDPLGFEKVNDLVLIADNDNNATDNFNTVANQIDAANAEGDLTRSLAKPIKPNKRAAGDPSVSIWMWPYPGKVGCLETLLWNIIKKVYPKWAACAESAYKCVERQTEPNSNKDKRLVRTFLCIACKKPLISVTMIWKEEKGLIPLDHEEFNPIKKFLKSI